MMNPVDPSQRLAAAVAAQLSALRGRSASRAEAGARASGPARSRHGVSAVMAQRIAAIAPDDPDRPRKAVRIYLEAEIAQEFGAALLNDRAFATLLDAVQQRMQDDAQTASAVQTLGRLLLAGRIIG
jgi:hypothetical protein